ncbi:secreted protein/lipoprotein [Streptomyces sp. NPDC006307]|uniref:secreted protein/lipoprotein n=1 Tax=Streptomyces sp. NPDC006307 TaxID=3156748 RepID=UPI0033B87C7C
MDPTESAKNHAIAIYRSYWQEMEKLYADPGGTSANLKVYAAAAALKAAESDAKRAHDRNRIHIGKVTVGNPTVTKADLDREIPNVTLSSCLDISQWHVVDATTKKPVTLPSNRLTKYVIVTTIERWPEGWRVIRDEPQGKAC